MYHFVSYYLILLFILMLLKYYITFLFLFPGSSVALGVGYRLGFLGVLHMEVFTQRLEDEYNASVIVTPPNVSYRIKLQDNILHK